MATSNICPPPKSIISDMHIMKCKTSRTMKQMRQPRSKECCYLHWIQKVLYEINFTVKMPEDSKGRDFCNYRNKQKAAEQRRLTSLRNCVSVYHVSVGNFLTCLSLEVKWAWNTKHIWTSHNVKVFFLSKLSWHYYPEWFGMTSPHLKNFHAYHRQHNYTFLVIGNLFSFVSF